MVVWDDKVMGKKLKNREFGNNIIVLLSTTIVRRQEYVHKTVLI